MNRNTLKQYAPQARRDFIAAVTDRAAYYGLTAQKIEPLTAQGDVVLIGGNALPRSVAIKRRRLEERITHQGFEPTMEALAYTWFNRFAAIRFMELHGYLDHGYRVLSHPDPEKTTPEILEHAEHIDLPGLNQATVIDLKLDGTREAELYRMLLIAQCNALHVAMPFLFERIDDETELLLPDNLLHSDSLIRKLVNGVDEEDWQEVEIIGWLYQFYISEKKDQVIGKVVKREDIPAATQLFTPDWIVKYLVQNSLGRQWMATYPNSPLKQQMEYYIEPAEQTPEVQAQLKAITPESLNPEELTLLDPACGSGHILVEAYDLFKAIYQERGYRARDIPSLILQKNLFGLEIDDRAAQLASFALMMKARADDRRLFERGVKLNVMALVDSTDFDVKRLATGVELADYGLQPSDLTELKQLFEHATTFGSLIQVPAELAARLPAMKQLSEPVSQDLFVSDALKRLGPLAQQGELLAARYDAVVANPPYIGSKFHIPVLKKFLKDRYNGYEKDVFSAFIDRDLAFSKPHGRLGFMSPQVWMFLSSYEELRARLIDQETITTLVQPEYNAFWDSAHVTICSYIVQKTHVAEYTGTFIRLTDFYGAEIQPRKTLEAIKNPDCGWLYRAKPDEFKKILGQPIAYWVSERMRQCFKDGMPLGEIAEPRQGMYTADNARFLRRWHEVSYVRVGFRYPNRETAQESRLKWFPYNKGGEFRRWFGNNEWLVNWEKDGHEIQNFTDDTGYLRSRPQGLDCMFRPALTWTKISSSFFAVRCSDQGFLFDGAGSCAFPPDEWRECIAGFLCSSIAFDMMKVLNPTMNFQVGNVAALPILQPQLLARKSVIDAVVREAVQLARTDWDSFETSWNFQTLPVLQQRAATLAQSQAAADAEVHTRFQRMQQLEEENNRLFIDAYGLQDELSPEVPEDQITLYRPNREEDIKRLVSYAIGCMMGRYSLDKPGLVYAHSGNKGFDPSQYQTFPADDDGIIPMMETDWFPDDASNLLVEFISVAWPKEHLAENLTFIADSLSPNRNEQPRDTIRRYLATGFYKHHLSMYKRRPIYWLFSSGKQRAFQCLVYLHRYHEGTLSRMRTEYVIPLQGKMASRLDQLTDDIAAASSTSHRKRLEKERDTLRKQHTELQAFDEQLRHYADRRISLDLDDGVKVNYGKFGDLLAEVKAVTGGSMDES